MNIHGFLVRTLASALAIWGCASAARAQVTNPPVTITASDMFNQIGQYFRGYANDPSNTVDVTALSLGTTGGPQAWNFAAGPTDVIYRFDYVASTNGTGGADFQALGAQLAEQKTDEADVSTRSWLYFTQDLPKGRQVYGFYDPTFSASLPQSVFTNVLQDFPNTIHYGDAWQGTTVFESEYYVAEVDMIVPEQLTYTATAKVDAYGFVTLPTLGFLECLRVHELVQYDVGLDLGGGNGYADYSTTQYALNYYWLCPGHGMVVQIASTQSETGPPADNLPGGATSLVRMFETNHPDAEPPPPETIKGLNISIGKLGALLSWTKLATVSSYRVDYSIDLSQATNWQAFPTTTTNLWYVDGTANRTNTPLRFYRVVGLN